MWRITVSNLQLHGLPTSTVWNNKHNYGKQDADDAQVHINILEFFVIFIELWIVLRQLNSDLAS